MFLGRGHSPLPRVGGAPLTPLSAFGASILAPCYRDRPIIRMGPGLPPAKSGPNDKYVNSPTAKLSNNADCPIADIFSAKRRTYLLHRYFDLFSSSLKSVSRHSTLIKLTGLWSWKNLMDVINRPTTSFER